MRKKTRLLNWARILRRGAPFSPREIREAASWRTCAVGEAHQNHPKTVKVDLQRLVRAPLDSTLDVRGTEFWEALKNQDQDGARAAYVHIQTRVAELEVGVS